MKTILILTSSLLLLSFISTNKPNIIQVDQYKVVYEKAEGKYTGKYSSYYNSTGKIRAKGKLLNGMHVGEWIIYDSTGEIRVQRSYSAAGDLIKSIPAIKTLESAEESKEGLVSVIWSKRLWRFIPLDNNKEFFQSKFLSNTLISLAKENKITSYNPSSDEFLHPTSFDRLANTNKKIVTYKIKEDNYYNKYTQQMEIQIIGICPIVEVDNKQVDLAWFYFPEFIEQLKENNTESNQILLRAFQTRNFHSFITKESNRNNLTLSKYKLENNQTLSGLREEIEIGLIEKEHDLWIEQIQQQ